MEEPKNPLIKKINRFGLAAVGVLCALGGLYLCFAKGRTEALFMCPAGIMLTYAKLKYPDE